MQTPLYNQAMVAYSFLPYLPFAFPFPYRMDKFNAVSVSDSEYHRFCQKPFCPILMGFQKPKQPCPFRKFGKQRKEVTLEPSVKLSFAFSSHGKEKSYSDNFAWIEFGLAVFWDIFHLVVYHAEELDDKIFCWHKFGHGS